jgi:hypothetical protein
MHVETTGAAVPAFDWQLQATLDLGYTRTFRDHSIGTLVQFTEATSLVDGKPAPSLLKGLRVELRAFDRGEVLALSGADAGLGQQKHLEALDVLWPALAPRVELKNDGLTLFTSWPIAENWQWGRSFLEARGTRTHQKGVSELSWAGDLKQKDSLVERSGTVDAHARTDDRNERTLESHWGVEREVHPLWRAGLTQKQHLVLNLTYLGSAAPLPILPPEAADSRYADSLPLVLSDGQALQHPEVRPEEALLFLVLPDTWTPAEIAAALGG